MTPVLADWTLTKLKRPGRIPGAFFGIKVASLHVALAPA